MAKSKGNEQSRYGHEEKQTTHFGVRCVMQYIKLGLVYEYE